jgi:hypothetical protein
MDVHVHSAITDALRQRGADVLTAQGDGADRLLDPALLDRATSLGRLLFSRDSDLLREAVHRQRDGIPFAGVAYAHPLRLGIGACIRELELLALAGEPEDFANRIVYLPLR